MSGIELNVVTQNILLDYGRTEKGLVRPQSERLASITATLARLGEPIDVAGIQEAHTLQNGISIATQLGYDEGVWTKHNRKIKNLPKGRPDEFIGLFGRLVADGEAIDLGDRRAAMVTVIGKTAFATFHLRSGLDARQKRGEQAEALCEALSQYENAVVFGDLNEPVIPKYGVAREELKNQGFKSVFGAHGHPRTSPTLPYTRAALSGRGWQAAFAAFPWSIDDIQVRGNIEVLARGVLRRVIVKGGDSDYSGPWTGSDHNGIWARLCVPG